MSALLKNIFTGFIKSTMINSSKVPDNLEEFEKRNLQPIPHTCIKIDSSEHNPQKWTTFLNNVAYTFEENMFLKTHLIF